MWEADDGTAKALMENVKELGNWHEFANKVWRYLTVPEKAVSALIEIQQILTEDKLEYGFPARLKLGSMKVFAESLVPLFQAYRENADVKVKCLAVMETLSMRPIGLTNQENLKHLEYLQDYKEAFAKKDMFLVLMTIMGETMDSEGQVSEAPEDENSEHSNKSIFGMVLHLFRNLISVPDPRPGDAGYSPLRRSLTCTYICHLHMEGVMDFFLLFLETVVTESDVERGVVLLDILYHICTQVDPDKLTASPEVRKSQSKNTLGMLLEQEQAMAKLRTPQSSRHARFGTRMAVQTAAGGSSLMSTVSGSSGKAGRGFRPKYANATGSDKKRNMFHDPFFVDLEEGSVRDHNALNPFMAAALEAPNEFEDGVLGGLFAFFQEFVQTSFSQFVSMLRRLIMVNSKDHAKQAALRPKILNFVAWVLEFHRLQYVTQASKAKKAKQEVPVIDITTIQGAIDLDMLQFVAARLREYGKESDIHSSYLVLVLRTMAQQVKALSVVIDARESETRDCGDALMQNLVKDDIMFQLGWIMKNYKATSHDPRILSYTVEVFHYTTRNLGKMAERVGHATEYATERHMGNRIVRGTTSAEKEVGQLADSRVIDNLFVLLEKYKRHTSQFISMLVKLIYSIVKARPTNVVVFFELPYFIRINKIMSDPVVLDKKAGRRYEDMQTLLQHILRQFFKCAEKNQFVFVELLFRKVAEKEALTDTHASEFAAILNDYNDDSYRTILEQMRAGETLRAVKAKQRANLDGQAPWTEEEDEILRSRHWAYIDHPLCAELLSAELPENMRRTGRQVRKRLVELGLVSGGGGQDGEKGEKNPSDPADEDDKKRKPDEVDLSKDGEPSAKKAKLGEDDASFFAPAADLGDGEVGAELSIEDQLESLLRFHEAELNESMTDSLGPLAGGGASAQPVPAEAPAPATALDVSCAATVPELSVSLGGAVAATSTACSATALEPTAAAATALEATLAEDGGFDLDLELEAMMDEGCASQVPGLGSEVPQGVDPAASAAAAQLREEAAAAKGATAEAAAPGACESEGGAARADSAAEHSAPPAGATMAAPPCSAESQGDSWLEKELEDLIGSEMPGASQVGKHVGEQAAKDSSQSQSSQGAWLDREFDCMVGGEFAGFEGRGGSHAAEGQSNAGNRVDTFPHQGSFDSFQVPRSPKRAKAVAPREAATPQRRTAATAVGATPAPEPGSSQLGRTPWSAQAGNTPITPWSAKQASPDVPMDEEEEKFWQELKKSS